MAGIDELAEREAQGLNVAQAPQPESIDTKLQKQDARGKGGLWSAIKGLKFADYMKIGATSVFGAVLGGGLFNLAATAGGYVIGQALVEKKKMNTKSLKSEMYLGGLMTPILDQFFKVVHAIPGAIPKTLLGVGVGMPVVLSAMLPLRYLTRNYNPVKIVKNIFKLPSELYHEVYKKDYVNALKEAYKYLALPVAATMNFVPLQYQVATMAPMRIANRVIVENAVAKKPTEPAKELSLPEQMPYAPAPQQYRA